MNHEYWTAQRDLSGRSMHKLGTHAYTYSLDLGHGDPYRLVCLAVVEKPFPSELHKAFGKHDQVHLSMFFFFGGRG